MASNIVSLQEVKTHLRYQNPQQPTADDTALQWFINAADEVIQYECDTVLPRVYSEFHDGGGYCIYTWHVPILEVMNVEEGWDWINYELDYAQVNAPAAATSMFAYSIDNFETGQISRRSAANIQIPFRPGTGNIQIQYRAGLQDIPGAVFLAELELIAHWWQNSQLRAVAVAGSNVGYDLVQGQLYSRDSESGVQNLNIGVPFRILEMIKAYRRRPFIA